MSALRNLLVESGIAELPNLYTEDQIQHMNSILGPFFDKKSHEKRSYAHPDELVELGLWNDIFSEGMRKTLFTIMPDPVLFHAHAYEIAGNSTKSHIFSESLSGWHRDPDSAYVKGDPSHISIFIYLSDVGPTSGAFEFVPNCSPDEWLAADSKFISVTGRPGYSFAWHRSYFHRASANQSPVRRRLIKLSIQRNAYHSPHLANPHFSKVLQDVPSGDPYMDLLLGRYQGKKPPVVSPLGEVDALPVATNSKLDLPAVGVMKTQAKLKAMMVINKMRGREIALAPYD